MPLRLADECLSLSMAWVITGPDQGGNAGEGRVNSAWCWERKETTCLHLGFGLVDSRTVNKIHFCCVKPPSLWYLATADLAKEYPPHPPALLVSWARWEVTSQRLLSHLQNGGNDPFFTDDYKSLALVRGLRLRV